jgi:hypothetical protein
VATRIWEFCGGDDDVPVIFCGDFNSQPKSLVHRYLTEGVVNAKTAAPWYALSVKREKQEMNDDSRVEKEPNSQEIMDLGLSMLSLSNGESVPSRDAELSESRGAQDRVPEVRYILDFTLNRFCRWLRILGLNAALETEEEEIERTKHGRM